MLKKSQVIAGIIINTILILVISKLATGSLNPFEIFRGDSILLMIVVGFLMFMIVMTLLSALWARVVIGDRRCAACNNPLLSFAFSHGPPARCLRCGQWYHTNCLKACGGSVFGCKQPHCPSGQAIE